MAAPDNRNDDEKKSRFRIIYVLYLKTIYKNVSALRIDDSTRAKVGFQLRRQSDSTIWLMAFGHAQLKKIQALIDKDRAQTKMLPLRILENVLVFMESDLIARSSAFASIP